MDTQDGTPTADEEAPPPFMYPATTASDLTPEQCRLLDETFFGSSATAYWRARIDGLLREPEPVDYNAGVAASLAGLGLDPEVLARTEPTARERETQRALDAFALRHHLAESLVRLVHAVLTVRGDPDKSVWATMAGDRKNRGVDLVTDLVAVQEDGVPVLELFLPSDLAEQVEGALTPELEGALRMHWTWVQRAMELLVTDGLDSTSGNNKLKHGFAVRARDDHRVDFMLTPPNPDGTVPLSAAATAAPLVDAVSLEFLERIPGNRPQGGSWEVTVLNLRPAELIAEALQLCVVWASVFTAEASRRVEAKGAGGIGRAMLTSGPGPEPMQRRPTGLRQGLTAAADGKPPRPLTLQVGDRFVTFVSVGPGRRTTIVDDSDEVGARELREPDDEQPTE